MYLSVIIPTRNRANTLYRTLDSISNQTLPAREFEVIIIDNGSTDNTRETIEEFRNKLPNLRYFYETSPGLHIGRHKGLKEADSDILVYGDDDIKAFPTWLQGIKESFSDNQVVLVGGKVLPHFEESPPDWLLNMWNRENEHGKILTYLSILDLGEKVKEINPYYVFGCNYSIRKNILIDAGGFHPDSFPPDLIKYRGDGEGYVSKYIMEKKYKTMYNPGASVYHLISKDRITLEYFCKRAYNEGISDSYSQTRYGNMTKTDNSLKKLIKNIYNKFIKIQHENNDEILTQISLHHDNGWKYHRQEIKNDPELLKWIIKENYLD